jgi:hypothetical protein
MTRGANGGDVQFVGGTTVSLPTWLELDWSPTDHSTFSSPLRVIAKVSDDGITYTPVGPNTGITINFARAANAYPIPPGTTYQVGAFVSSHDANAINTAHFDGLSFFPQGTVPVEIGNTGLIGNGVVDWTVQGLPLVVEGAGADIWGTSDSFQFFELPQEASTGPGLEELVTIDSTNAFAKAGLMYRDGVAPSAQAPMVILDLKPDGGVEFMARPCFGCAVMFLAGTNVGAPAWLRLSHSGTSTFSATVTSKDLTRTVDLGSVTVPMNTLAPGYAVTSHDPTKIAVGVFSRPAQ